jgi:hypothetical protein
LNFSRKNIKRLTLKLCWPTGRKSGTISSAALLTDTKQAAEVVPVLTPASCITGKVPWGGFNFGGHPVYRDLTWTFTASRLQYSVLAAEWCVHEAFHRCSSAARARCGCQVHCDAELRRGHLHTRYLLGRSSSTNWLLGVVSNRSGLVSFCRLQVRAPQFLTALVVFNSLTILPLSSCNFFTMLE